MFVSIIMYVLYYNMLLLRIMFLNTMKVDII